MNDDKYQSNLTEQEAANILGISVATLRRWRWTGTPELPFIKLGRNVRYRLEDLLAFNAANKHTSTTSALAQDQQ